MKALLLEERIVTSSTPPHNRSELLSHVIETQSDHLRACVRACVRIEDDEDEDEDEEEEEEDEEEEEGG